MGTMLVIIEQILGQYVSQKADFTATTFFADWKISFIDTGGAAAPAISEQSVQTAKSPVRSAGTVMDGSAYRCRCSFGGEGPVGMGLSGIFALVSPGKRW